MRKDGSVGNDGAKIRKLAEKEIKKQILREYVAMETDTPDYASEPKDPTQPMLSETDNDDVEKAVMGALKHDAEKKAKADLMAGGAGGDVEAKNVSGKVDKNGQIEGVTDVEPEEGDLQGSVDGEDEPGGDTPVSPEDDAIVKAKKQGGLMGQLGGGVFANATAQR